MKYICIISFYLDKKLNLIKIILICYTVSKVFVSYITRNSILLENFNFNKSFYI